MPGGHVQRAGIGARALDLRLPAQVEVHLLAQAVFQHQHRAGLHVKDKQAPSRGGRVAGLVGGLYTHRHNEAGFVRVLNVDCFAQNIAEYAVVIRVPGQAHAAGDGVQAQSVKLDTAPLRQIKRLQNGQVVVDAGRRRVPFDGDAASIGVPVRRRYAGQFDTFRRRVFLDQGVLARPLQVGGVFGQRPGHGHVAYVPTTLAQRTRDGGLDNDNQALGRDPHAQGEEGNDQ